MEWYSWTFIVVLVIAAVLYRHVWRFEQWMMGRGAPLVILCLMLVLLLADEPLADAFVLGAVLGSAAALPLLVGLGARWISSRRSEREFGWIRRGEQPSEAFLQRSFGPNHHQVNEFLVALKAASPDALQALRTQLDGCGADLSSELPPQVRQKQREWARWAAAIALEPRPRERDATLSADPLRGQAMAAAEALVVRDLIPEERFSEIYGFMSNISTASMRSNEA